MKFIDNIAKKILAIMLLSFVLYILVVIIRTNNLRNQNNYVIGTITGYKEYRGVINLKYKYVVDNMSFEISDTYNFHKTSYEKFINKQFVVVYSIKNPKNSHLLLTSNAYDLYDLEFPDSLNWLLDCK